MTLDRNKLIRNAQETLRAIDTNGYQTDIGRVDLTVHLNRMRAGTQLYTPSQLGALSSSSRAGRKVTTIQVTRETTLAAARRLLAERDEAVAVLNFASATTPGGGFLTGSAAQEESLCRASGLYSSLNLHPEYYEFHRQQRDRLYTDRLMFAPNVPVFRDDDGQWLNTLFHMDVLTAAAPNLRGLSDTDYAAAQPEAQATIERRASQILAVFHEIHCDRLILGAWGCGAFRNDPTHVATTFRDLLRGPYQGAFSEVVLAVFAMPWEEKNLHAFQRTFAE